MEPRIRNGICLSTHPEGCKEETRRQIAFIREAIKKNSEGANSPSGPKSVLVLGCSGGYGLASRIAAAFGYGAATLGVAFEKEPTEKKPGTSGYYNLEAFDEEAFREGLSSLSLNGDAFSAEMKEQVTSLLSQRFPPVDLIVYSLASGVRTDPATGITYRSVLKPLGNPYTARSLDPFTEKVEEVTINPATEEELASTVKVMGGEDWELWIKALAEKNLLAPGVITLAYSYLGPAITYPVYREGTIGKAKEHLEATADKLTALLSPLGGRAFVSVNKALVTKASAVIPVVPLYITLLFKVMKRKGLHEDCIEQIHRLFSDRLYTGKEVPLDSRGRIRIDDWEMREDVQREVQGLWDSVTQDNIREIADLAGYREDFLRIHGFSVPGVNYSD